MGVKSLFLTVLALAAALSGCASPSHENGTTLTTERGISTESSRHTHVIQKGATPSRFDSIEGALTWRDGQCVLHQSAFDGGAQVYDFVTGEEVPVREAIYVAGQAVEDETGHAVIGFKTRQRAERFVGSRGGLRVLSYDELLGEKLR